MRLKQRDLLLKMKYVFHFISNFKVFLEDVPNEDQDAEELINIWQNLGISEPNVQEIDMWEYINVDVVTLLLVATDGTNLVEMSGASMDTDESDSDDEY